MKSRFPPKVCICLNRILRHKIQIYYYFFSPKDGVEKEKQQPDKKPKLSFGMMKKTLPAKSGIKITLNSPATVSIIINVKH